MKGLVIWAHSYCRSTIAFYLSFGHALGSNFKIFVKEPASCNIRTKVGFSNNEFKDDHIEFITENFTECKSLLLKYKSWNHIFGAYQNRQLYQALINTAIKNHIIYGIASEAPCNMSAPPIRYVKNIYLRYYLPIKLRSYIKNASFIINLSGEDDKLLRRIGWKSSQIIPCGYYSPPVPNSQPKLRGEQQWENFTILLSGIHEWHRSPIVLLQALKILNERNLKFKCIITQNGPELGSLKLYSAKFKLNNLIEFIGFVEFNKLIHLYENCSVYIGAGNYEPWGMRLNDVLQCGAPLIVNQGMGGRLLVDKYHCGLTFQQNNPSELANRLEDLITHKDKYITIAQNAFLAAKEIAPEIIAPKIRLLTKNFPNW